MTDLLKKRAEEAMIEVASVIEEMMPHVQKAILESDKCKAGLQVSFTWKGDWTRNPLLIVKGSVPAAVKTAQEPKLCADPLQPELPIDGAK